jgi:DNA-nicking Smr family endonuclease
VTCRCRIGRPWKSNPDDELKRFERSRFMHNEDIAAAPAGYIEAPFTQRASVWTICGGDVLRQAWLDLHGMNRQEARFALDEFFWSPFARV